MVSETGGTARDGIRVTELAARCRQCFGSTAPSPVTEFAAAVQQPLVAVRFAAAKPLPCSLEVLERGGLDGAEAAVRLVADTKRQSSADSFRFFT